MDRIEPKFVNTNDEDNILSHEPEKNKNIHYPLANAGVRYIAQIIDGIIALLIFVSLTYLVKLYGLKSTQLDLITVGIPIMYYLFCDALPNGQSLGKIIFKISVISKKTGNDCNLLQSFLRNITTPFLGWLDAIFILTKSKRRIGDYLAGTIVVKKDSKAAD